MSSRSLRVRKRCVDYTDSLEEDDEPEKKKSSKSWAIKVFYEFCDEVGIPIRFTHRNIPSLAHALQRLYAGARAEKYELYLVSTFRLLRAMLKKHFQKTLKVDIITDEEFEDANKAFTDRETRIKGASEGLIRVFSPVQEKDLKLLKEYFENNMQNPTPQQLLEYIWFILQYYNCQLAPDGCDNLKITHFIIQTDPEGKKYILQNEYEQVLSRHRNQCSKESISDSLIPAMEGDVLCPVTAFKLYKSKIHKDLDKLFQTPKKHVDPQQEYWFDRIPLRRSSLKEMMTTLSQNAKLSTRYTNQSLTGAAIANLIWSENLGKVVPSNSKPSNRGEKTKMIRQVKMKSPLSITIVKKKQGRQQNYETTSVNKNRVAELLNQEISPLKTDSSMANPPPIINMTKGSQQQGVKLLLNKSIPSVSSVNNALRALFAAPSHRQVLPPPKQPPFKSGTSSSSTSNNNNKQSEMLTSNKTELYRMFQPIKSNEKSTVISQNVEQSKPGEVPRDGYKEAPSSENEQDVQPFVTGVQNKYQEAPSLVNEADVQKSRVDKEEYQKAPSLVNEQNFQKSGIDEDEYQEAPSLVNEQNFRKFRIDESLQDEYQEANEPNVWKSKIEELRGKYPEVRSLLTGQNVRKSRIDEVLGSSQETPSSANGQNVQQSRLDDVILVDEYRVPPPRQLALRITNVHSCGGFFTNRNVAETIVKPVETPTHSYVIHNHQSSMLANMAELWKKGKFCDATIGNGTMKIMVHKIVLLALSPQLVDSSNSDLTSECFQFNFPQEIGGDALWAFSKYMYEGVVSLNSDVLEDMEQISAILNLQDLKDTCNLYRNQVNLPIKTTRSSQLLATKHLTPADHTAINLNPLPASIKSEASQSVATIKSEASPNGVTIKSEASPNGTTIKSETSLSVVTIKSEASPSVVAIQSETSQIRAATKSETSPNVVAIQSETSQIRAATKSETSSIRAAIKSEASQSEISVFSLPSGDVTETVSRPAQHLQIMMPEFNNTRLNQSSIGGVNRATDDRTCVTISGSDSDSDLTLVSSNSKKNLVRKRRSRHIKNNFLQSRQPESFLNDNMRESWPPHSYNRNDNLTNPSQSKQMKLSDNLVIDHSQSFEISYAGSNQRSNNVPYSLIEDSDESS